MVSVAVWHSGHWTKIGSDGFPILESSEFLLEFEFVAYGYSDQLTPKLAYLPTSLPFYLPVFLPASEPLEENANFFRRDYKQEDKLSFGTKNEPFFFARKKEERKEEQYITITITTGAGGKN